MRLNSQTADLAVPQPQKIAQGVADGSFIIKQDTVIIFLLHTVNHRRNFTREQRRIVMSRDNAVHSSGQNGVIGFFHLRIIVPEGIDSGITAGQELLLQFSHHRRIKTVACRIRQNPDGKAFARDQTAGCQIRAVVHLLDQIQYLSALLR